VMSRCLKRRAVRSAGVGEARLCSKMSATDPGSYRPVDRLYLWRSLAGQPLLIAELNCRSIQGVSLRYADYLATPRLSAERRPFRSLTRSSATEKASRSAPWTMPARIVGESG